MTRKELISIYKKLDLEKYGLLSKDVAYDFIILDKKTGETMHSGIGSGGDMTVMVLTALKGIYQGAVKDMTVEEFAEDVKNTFIRFCEAYDVEGTYLTISPEGFPEDE